MAQMVRIHMLQLIVMIFREGPFLHCFFITFYILWISISTRRVRVPVGMLEIYHSVFADCHCICFPALGAPHCVVRWVGQDWPEVKVPVPVFVSWFRNLLALPTAGCYRQGYIKLDQESSSTQWFQGKMVFLSKQSWPNYRLAVKNDS